MARRPTDDEAAGARGRRSPMSLERVLSTALALADAGGLEAVSMRRVGQELGVEGMTLYYYVKGKDDILDGILDRALQEVEVPPDDTNWRTAVKQLAVSEYATLRRHPWAGSLIMSPVRVRTTRLGHIDAMLRFIARGGFSDEFVDLAYHALDSHIIGTSLWEASFTTAMTGLDERGAAVLAAIPLERYPNVVAHRAWHEEPREGPSSFEFAIDVILDGLERARDIDSNANGTLATGTR